VAELFALTTAEVKPAITTANYQIILLTLNWEQSLIVIHLRGENGELKEFRYGGPTGTDADRTKARGLIVALNKANLSTTSLQKRILNQLVTDGLLSGTVTGTPE
jgi:hypothetical protein